jgi:hypothetical protein
MPDARAIISGDPGTTWQNDTDKPWYQLHVADMNTCGLCWQYSERIARYWALPLHRNCRCRQTVIQPGRRASKPFIDYQAAVKALPVDQQVAVMGKAVFRLWTKGVIDWAEAVQPGRIRSLAEIVSRRRLSVKAMVKAGVDPKVARRAFDSVHTPEHRAVEAHRRDLLDKIHAAGVGHDLVVKHIGERLASRVGIAAGPGYTTKAGVVLPGIKAAELLDPAALRRKHADELAALLGSAAAIGAATAAMRKRRKKKAEEDESGDEPWKPLKPAE